jgi:5'-methylthioadenosine phosphorylase
MKQVGVERLIGVNAVGSLAEEYAPGHLVLPDDLFDRTSGRPNSFYGPGLVGHIAMATPFCPFLQADLLSADSLIDAPLHHGGTLVVINGPRFSTRAESLFHRDAGFKLVGMTTLPEAALAVEAGMCYAALCLVTDFDAWRESEADVTADMVVSRLAAVSREAQRLVRAAVPALVARAACGHGSDAVITHPEAVDPGMQEKLAPLGILAPERGPDPKSTA